MMLPLYAADASALWASHERQMLRDARSAAARAATARKEYAEMRSMLFMRGAPCCTLSIRCRRFDATGHERKMPATPLFSLRAPPMFYEAWRRASVLLRAYAYDTRYAAAPHYRLILLF